MPRINLNVPKDIRRVGSRRDEGRRRFDRVAASQTAELRRRQLEILAAFESDEMIRSVLDL